MELSVVDLAPYLAIRDQGGCRREEEEEQMVALCAAVSRSLRETGALLVKDPRCSAEDNDRFIDMMERYFECSDSFKRLQERPHLHYQVGVTPEGVEVPRSLVDEDMKEKLSKMPKVFQPSTPEGPDPKWRYMWRVGPRPSNTRFQELNSEPVIPGGFPDWQETMDLWGIKMISAIEVVAEMAATGFGLPKDAFTSLMKQPPSFASLHSRLTTSGRASPLSVRRPCASGRASTSPSVRPCSLFSSPLLLLHFWPSFSPSASLRSASVRFWPSFYLSVRASVLTLLLAPAPSPLRIEESAVNL